MQFDINNREIATIILLAILIILFSFKSQIRAEIKNVLSALFQGKILVLIFAYMAYGTVLYFALELLGLPVTKLQKELFGWFFLVGFSTIVRVGNTNNKSRPFLSLFVSTLKFTVFIEFVANIATFSLPIELALVPFVTFVVILEAISKDQPEHKSTNTLMNSLLIIIGLIVIINSLNQVITHFQKHGQLLTIIKFILPAILTSLLIPFLFIMLTLSCYEQISIRLKIRTSKNLLRYAKYKIFLYCKMNYFQTRTMLYSQFFNSITFRSKDDVLMFLKKFRESAENKTSTN